MTAAMKAATKKCVTLHKRLAEHMTFLQDDELEETPGGDLPAPAGDSLLHSAIRLPPLPSTLSPFVPKLWTAVMKQYPRY